MRRWGRLAAVVALAALLAAFPAFGRPQAETRPKADVTGWNAFSLPNGLEVFVLENHQVPLVRVQIAFRCGSVTQEADTAGLFHLYEHMLFKGNRVYASQTDFQAAMKELGVGSWNGGTGTESVSYYFTIPSDVLEQGLSFWANAVRYPLFDAGELATEKDVVANEIRANFSDPDRIYLGAQTKALWSKYPWRKDTSGYEKAVRSATPEILARIRDTWYVPNNAALFVGGDASPQDVRRAVEKAFGDWKRGADPWASPAPSHPFPQRDVRLVYPDEQTYRGLVPVSIQFRGPDVTADPKATYAADTWGNFVSDPNGPFRTNLFSKVPGLYRKEYVDAYYVTQRDGGYVQFSTYLLVRKGEDTFQRVLALQKTVESEFAAMATDPSYFSLRDYDVMKARLADERILERETPDGFIGQLMFWWATAGTEYYRGYTENLMKTGQKEIADFLNTYLIGRKSVLSFRMNPQDLAAESGNAEKAGFSTISKDDAFWWQEAGR